MSAKGVEGGVKERGVWGKDMLFGTYKYQNPGCTATLTFINAIFSPASKYGDLTSALTNANIWSNVIWSLLSSITLASGGNSFSQNHQILDFILLCYPLKGLLWVKIKIYVNHTHAFFGIKVGISW